MAITRPILAGAVLFCCLIFVFIAFRAGGPERTPIKSGAKKLREELPPSLTTTGTANATEVTAAVTLVTTPPAPGGQAVPQILEAIHEASISYDAKELPKIQPYLIHPDREVRTAALEGVLTLGAAAGSPLLRQAASTLKDPREAVKYLEAADYLELPSGSLLAGKKKKSGSTSKAGTPSKGEPSPRIPFRSKKD